MHDNVFNAMHGYFYQINIECYSTFIAAASPSSVHSANHQHRLRHTVPRCNDVAFFQVTTENLPRSFSIPLIYSLFNDRSIVIIFNPNPEKTTHQFGGLFRVLYNLESVLSSQINEGFSAHVSFRDRQGVVGFQLIKRSCYPRSFLLHS